MYRISLIIVFFFFTTIYLYSQCDCPGNVTEISLGNLSELYDNNEFTGNNFFVSTVYKYSYGDSYYSGNENIGDGPIESLSSNFMNLRISYKPTVLLVLETDLGYLIDKTQTESLSNEEFHSKGFSDLTIYARYIFYKNLNLNFEFSAGTGLKIPLSKGSEYVPQNIQPSTGAYALLFNFFLKKYYPEIKSGFILGNRTDYNFENSWNYRYGNSYITSLVYLYNLNEYFNLGFEIRNDIRSKDYDDGKKIAESGMYSFNFSPLIRFLYDDFAVTGFYNFPFYQYYYGEQIANKYSFGISFSLNTTLK